MKRVFALCAAVVLLTWLPASGAENSANIPANYKLVYASDFASPKALQQFTFTDPKAWQIAKDDGAPSLELFEASKYVPKFRSPFNIALLKDKVFTDVIIECEACSTVKPYGHQDMCIIYGFVSPSQFYYTHIAVAPDPHAHNCFIVNNAERLAVGKDVSKGVTWGVNEWHKLRIVRKGSDGTTTVYFDDMSKPIMRAVDKNFPSGAIGFGSFDDKGKFRNIRVHAPAVEEKKTEGFSKDAE
jgi:hypothetical protein